MISSLIQKKEKRNDEKRKKERGLKERKERKERKGNFDIENPNFLVFRQLQQGLAQLLLRIFQKELQIHASRWILYRSCENHVFEFSRLNRVKLFPRVFQGAKSDGCPIWMVIIGLIKDGKTIITVKVWGQSDKKYWRKRLKKSKISFVFQILSISNFFPGCFRGSEEGQKL